MADQDFTLEVTVRLYGDGSAADAADALKRYNGTFELQNGDEVEIIAASPGAPRTPGQIWDGYRVTLNCSHMLLTDLLGQDQLQVGQLTTCDMCPLTTHSEGSPGAPTRQVRLVVNRESVRALNRPENVPTAYWYQT